MSLASDVVGLCDEAKGLALGTLFKLNDKSWVVVEVQDDGKVFVVNKQDTDQTMLLGSKQLKKAKVVGKATPDEVKKLSKDSGHSQ